MQEEVRGVWGEIEVWGGEGRYGEVWGVGRGEGRCG